MKPIAVFTRNHRQYLDEAVKISKQNPNEPVVFRSRSRWATALREIPPGGSLPVYIAAIGSEGIIEYVAELCDGELDPQPGTARTKALLAHALKATEDEGLWADDGEPVTTLYAIRSCRMVTKPFPMTKLMKMSDGKPISEDYGYSYAIVQRIKSAD